MPLYIHAGVYNYAGGLNFYAGVDVFGDGMATVLNNVSASNYGISVQSSSVAHPYIVGKFSVARMKLTGASVGPAMQYDTEANCTLRDLHIVGCGGKGLLLAPTQHVSVLTLDGVKIQQCAGGGIYGRGYPSKQINSINVINGSEISQNGGHGVDVWGNVVKVENSTIQGNAGSGVRLDSSDSASESSVATTVIIRGNYMERNSQGDIRINGGVYGNGIYKLINSLEITSNYVYEPTGYSQKAVAFSRKGDGALPNAYTSQVVRSMLWQNNSINTTDAGADIVDFDNALADMCFIYLDDPTVGQYYTGDAEDARTQKFVNLGRGRMIATNNKVLPGFLHGYSPSVAYPSAIAKRSNSVTTSSSGITITYNLPLESMQLLLSLAVPIYFAATGTSVDVVFTLKSQQIGRDDLVSTIMTNTVSNLTGPADGKPVFAKSWVPEQATSNVDLWRAGGYQDIFQMDVTIKTHSGSADSSIQIGNPVMRYN